MASTLSLAGLLVLMLVQLNTLAHSISPDADAPRYPLLSAFCSGEPLGMESGDIPDSSIIASSIHSSPYAASRARLNVGTYGWIPASVENQWIQVDLGSLAAISGVIVQKPSAVYKYYVSKFLVQYSITGKPRAENWRYLANANGETIQFDGNDESDEPVTVTFPVIPVARFLRILPTAWSKSLFRLRFEVLGCRGDDWVRLTNGDGILSGRVEIYHGESSSWGTVCDGDWDIKDAKVVCKQLGFAEAQEAKTGSFFGESDLPIVMDRVSCTGTESHLSDCPFLCTSSQRCDNSHEAGVVCKPYTIRLVGGSDRLSGRVEIYRDESWGTICDNNWDIADAAVACRQLGFAGAEEAKSGAHFGEGEGPVYMDGVACAGSESKITDCPSFCWEEIKCNHTQDAGVICRNEDPETAGEGAEADI